MLVECRPTGRGSDDDVTNVMPAQTSPSWLAVMPSTNMPGAERQSDGPAILVTGHPSEPWCSIRSRAIVTLRPHDDGDNYLDAHRRNELLPFAQEGHLSECGRSAWPSGIARLALRLTGTWHESL